jgi:plastocyanin domain-containing protein
MKMTPVFILMIAVLIGVIIIFANRDALNKNILEDINNVSIVDGKQIIEIKARGGYFPKITQAKADMASIIRVTTESAFDCSIALKIPSLNYRKNLPMSGTTDVDVPPQKTGTILRGLCAMGMYNFQIKFE